MKLLLAVLVISWIHYSHAKLLITGHPIPSLRWDPFKVECLLQDSNYTIDDVQIEEFSRNEFWVTKKMKRWNCLLMPFPKIVWTENTLSMTVGSVYYNTSFRCALKGPNMTTPEYTELLNVTTTDYYLKKPQVIRGSSRCYDTLTVEAGGDVELKCKAVSSDEPKFSWYKEGDDWILPSSRLTLNNVSAMDEGRYTCVAEHPISPVSKNVTITLTVLPAGGKRSATISGVQKLWTKFGDVPQIVIATCAAFCLVLILSLTVYYCFYGRKVKTSKGPIDDHSAKKPIYKSSTESVPITCEDKRPLV